MKILGLDGVSADQLQQDLQQGARFVMFQYCISILILTFKRPSDIYYVRPGESAFTKGLAFTMISLVLGWWGIPWGPIYTFQSIYVNSTGGRDLTQEVLASILQSSATSTV